MLITNNRNKEAAWVLIVQWMVGMNCCFMFWLLQPRDLGQQTHPLVPSIGSSTQCRPDGPPSDLPSSIAERIPSLEKKTLYVPSSTIVSFTRSVIFSKISSAPSFLNSSESYMSTYPNQLWKTCALSIETSRKKQMIITSSATIEKEAEAGASIFKTRLTNIWDPTLTKRKLEVNGEPRENQKQHVTI